MLTILVRVKILTDALASVASVWIRAWTQANCWKKIQILGHEKPCGITNYANRTDVVRVKFDTARSCVIVYG
jgi:hypothetical protein